MSAENPELAEEDFDPYEDLDPSQWRKLVLAMEKEDGAVVGQTIDLDLPELGAAGTATVVAIEPCPALAPRPSERHHLVTGKFRHQVDELIDLHIEGLEEPITCTPNHLFWSEDRQEFVEAGELEAGRSIGELTGSKQIALVRRYDSASIVFNLEIFSQHVYRVGPNGVLVHNICENGVRDAFESMSAIAAKYQKQITGLPVGKVYFLNNVKFDGFKHGVLLDAKGLGYARLIRDPYIATKLAARIKADAMRQLTAANGTPIHWHVAEKPFADALRSFFTRNRINITVIHTPLIH